MSALHLAMQAGPFVPIPLPKDLTQHFDVLKVETDDRDSAGFAVTFRAGRAKTDALDYPLAMHPLLRAGNRFIATATVLGLPRVLIDGIITHRQLNPSAGAGGGTLTVMGKDLSVLMDRIEQVRTLPGMTDNAMVTFILAFYSVYGLRPVVVPPMLQDPPMPNARVPVQHGTDLATVRALAERHGYVFRIEPGPLPRMNEAWWGPPLRPGIPHRAINFNLGPDTNSEGLSFELDALAPTATMGLAMEPKTNLPLPVLTPAPRRLPMSREPAWLVQANLTRRKAPDPAGGRSYASAMERASGAFDLSASAAARARGTLDIARYGGPPLRPGAMVGVRGVGQTHDGLWYVRHTTHEVRIGSYKQSFVLEREGQGTLTPAVLP